MLSACSENRVKPNNINRRVLFAGFLAVPVVANAAPSAAPIEQVRSDAEALARSLAAAQGGEWSVQLDEDFALIHRTLPARRLESA